MKIIKRIKIPKINTKTTKTKRNTVTGGIMKERKAWKIWKRRKMSRMKTLTRTSRRNSDKISNLASQKMIVTKKIINSTIRNNTKKIIIIKICMDKIWNNNFHMKTNRSMTKILTNDLKKASDGKNSTTWYDSSKN